MSEKRDVSKYYFRQKEYIKAYAKAQYERGFGRHHVWATPEQWAVILAFAQQIKKIKRPQDIVGLNVLDNRRTFKLVFDKDIKKHGDYSDIPLMSKEEYLKQKEQGGPMWEPGGCEDVEKPVPVDEGLTEEELDYIFGITEEQKEQLKNKEFLKGEKND